MESIRFTEINSPGKVTAEDYKCYREDGQWKMILGRGECRTGGFDVILKKVILDGETLTAVVSFKDPDPKGFVTMVITYPTRGYLLDITQDIKKVIFQKENGDILKIIHI